MPNLIVTIHRTGADLIIPDYPDPAASFWLPEDAVVEPSWAFRTTYAPESAYIPGRTALAAVLDASSLPVVVYAQAIAGTSLAEAKAELEAAVSRFAYDVTVTVDGVARTYPADACWPQWGPVDFGMVSAGLARAQINFPVNPPTP